MPILRTHSASGIRCFQGRHTALRPRSVSDSTGSPRHPHLRIYRRATCVAFRKTNEEFGGLSNMASGFPILVNGVQIRTAEALYQSCRFPHRPDIQKIIIDQVSPMTAKMKGRPYQSESRPDWYRVRINIMRWCLRVKLVQHWERFSALLISTGEHPIVEESKRDPFWGAQPYHDQVLVGFNVLGRLLMELREEVMSSQIDPHQPVMPLLIPMFLLYGQPIEPVRDRRFSRPQERLRSIPRNNVTLGDRTPARQTRFVESSRQLHGAFNISRSSPGPESRSGSWPAYPVYRGAGLSWLERVPSH